MTEPVVGDREYRPDLYHISCRRHDEKTFSFVSTLKWGAADSRHKYWLAVGPVIEVGLFLVSFLLPLEPSIRKADRPAMLPEMFKHSASGLSLDARVNQWRFIPPPGRVTPEHRIEMQLLVAFAQQQDFCTGRRVVPTYRLWVICDITIGFIGQVSKILFTDSGLSKASTNRNLQSDVRLKVYRAGRKSSARWLSLTNGFRAIMLISKRGIKRYVVKLEGATQNGQFWGQIWGQN